MAAASREPIAACRISTPVGTPCRFRFPKSFGRCPALARGTMPRVGPSIQTPIWASPPTASRRATIGTAHPRLNSSSTIWKVCMIPPFKASSVRGTIRAMGRVPSTATVQMIPAAANIARG
jgi:hypothetical protein